VNATRAWRAGRGTPIRTEFDSTQTGLSHVIRLNIWASSASFKTSQKTQALGSTRTPARKRKVNQRNVREDLLNPRLGQPGASTHQTGINQMTGTLQSGSP
jgi:hypothetical protein